MFTTRGWAIPHTLLIHESHCSEITMTSYHVSAGPIVCLSGLLCVHRRLTRCIPFTKVSTIPMRGLRGQCPGRKSTSFSISTLLRKTIYKLKHVFTCTMAYWGRPSKHIPWILSQRPTRNSFVQRKIWAECLEMRTQCVTAGLQCQSVSHT